MKIIKKLKKKHARYRIEFEIDFDDNFLNINYITKNNHSKTEHLIISKDMNDWIDYYLHTGWSISE